MSFSTDPWPFLAAVAYTLLYLYLRWRGLGEVEASFLSLLITFPSILLISYLVD